MPYQVSSFLLDKCYSSFLCHGIAYTGAAKRYHVRQHAAVKRVNVDAITAFHARLHDSASNCANLWLQL